jgi:hypothetical protein
MPIARTGQGLLALRGGAGRHDPCQAGSWAPAFAPGTPLPTSAAAS